MTYVETVKKIWKRDPTTLVQMPVIASISYLVFSLADNSFNLKNFMSLLLLTLGASFIVTIVIFIINKKRSIL